MSHLENLFDLKNKLVVITGANGQLGKCITENFVQTGATVVGLDLDEKSKVAVPYHRANISNKQQVLDAMESIFMEYKKIDILINNAGVSTFEPFEERPEDKIDWIMDVNLKGTFFCIQNYVNLFDKYKQSKGAIVNIASFYGVISPDFRIYTDLARKNSEVYGATKAGIIQMTRYFAVHLANRNIRVNAVSPGGIYNPASPQGDDFINHYSFRCPMKRMAVDKEMFGAIAYLSCEAASYTTGQNIIIDGGMSCW